MYIISIKCIIINLKLPTSRIYGKINAKVDVCVSVFFKEKTMCILASDLFRKRRNTYLRLEICVVCREFYALKYIFLVLFEINQKS